MERNVRAGCQCRSLPGAAARKCDLSAVTSPRSGHTSAVWLNVDPLLDPRLQFGSAVLSRWPIDTSECVRLPVAEDAEPIAAGVPWELLCVRTAGLDVFSCHLAAAPQHARHRQRQVVAIDEHVCGIRGDLDAMVPPGERREGMPPILCGDFNAQPESDEIRFLSALTRLDGRTAYYQDAWHAAGDGMGYTFDWHTNPLAATLNVPRQRIDYVFVGDGFQRRGSAGRILSASLGFDTPLTGVVASDHAGLVVDIVWPDRPLDSASSQDR